VLRGVVLGVTQVALQYLLPDDLVVYKDAFLFLFVLAILILRPQGLFVREDAWRSRV
jgi:branched-chain amino acid transport system permease protein